MMQDILHESEIYQLLMQEGLEKGLEEGIQQQQEEELQVQRLSLIRIVQARFPTLARLASKRATSLKDLETLRELVVDVGASQTLKEVRKFLMEADKEDER